jgi:hypothetical protein
MSGEWLAQQSCYPFTPKRSVLNDQAEAAFEVGYAVH